MLKAAWEKWVAFVTLWIVASCPQGLPAQKSPDVPPSIVNEKTWVSEKTAVNLASGEKMLVIHLIRFNADGTYSTMVKTAQKGDADLGSSPVAGGTWFTGKTPQGKDLLCAQYNGGTWCAGYEIDADGMLEWGTGTYAAEPDDKVKEVAPEILGLPPLPYQEGDSAKVPKPKRVVDPDARES